jgi:hypothetical protein
VCVLCEQRVGVTVGDVLLLALVLWMVVNQALLTMLHLTNVKVRIV